MFSLWRPHGGRNTSVSLTHRVFRSVDVVNSRHYFFHVSSSPGLIRWFDFLSFFLSDHSAWFSIGGDLFIGGFICIFDIIEFFYRCLALLALSPCTIVVVRCYRCYRLRLLSLLTFAFDVATASNLFIKTPRQLNGASLNTDFYVPLATGNNSFFPYTLHVKHSITWHRTQLHAPCKDRSQRTTYEWAQWRPTDKCA